MWNLHHPRNYLIISTMKNSIFGHLYHTDLQRINYGVTEKSELKKFGEFYF